jgi:hypothetical protein
MSVGIPFGLGEVVGEKLFVGMPVGQLEGPAVGTEVTGDRDGNNVGYSLFFLYFFIPFGLGEAVGEKLFACAFVFRCSPRNWR